MRAAEFVQYYDATETKLRVSSKYGSRVDGNRRAVTNRMQQPLINKLASVFC